LWTVTNLSFKYQITIKIKWTVSKFSFSITIHNAFIFVDSNDSILKPFRITHMFI
jgi:hypothetical protein